MSLDAHCMVTDINRRTLDARAEHGSRLEQDRAAIRASSILSTRFRWSAASVFPRIRNGRQGASQRASTLSASVAS